MAKYNAHLERFTVGEYSESGLTRVDIDNARLAAEIQENIFPHIIGKGQVRPGTEYLGESLDNGFARLLAFARSPEEKALLELTGGALRVWVDDVVVTRNDVDSTVPALSSWINNSNDGGLVAVGALGPSARGGRSSIYTPVATGSPGVEHAVRVVIGAGPVRFKIGSSKGRDDLLSESLLDRGEHSLAFTPNGTYYLECSNFDQVYTQVSSVAIEAAGAMTVNAPWSTDDFQYFQFEQSADTIFCANRNLHPLKIERRGDTSWSVTYYEPKDGPFRIVTPGFGDVSASLSRSGSIWQFQTNFEVLNADMTNALVRVFHPNRNNTQFIAGRNTYCDVFEVSGVRGTNHNDRRFDYVITSLTSTAGTIRHQRSITGETGDFNATPRAAGTSTTTDTITGTGTVASRANVGNNEDNNLLAFHRIGFGPNDYVNGEISIFVSYQGDSGYGVARLKGISDQDTATAHICEGPNEEGVFTKSWEIGAWCEFYEWPSGVALHDNRLWWGGSNNVWASANGNFFSFDDRDTSDGATITRQLSTGGQSNQVNFLMPLQRLVAGTEGNELSLRASAVGEILTPTNVTVRTASSYGSAPVEPVRMDSRGVYIHRDGVTSMLLDYDGGTRDYVSTKLTEYKGDILEPGCTGLAVQRQPETYVWHIREDGQAPILLLNLDDPDNPVFCWSRFVTDGKVESIAVLPDVDEDRVYLSVNRRNFDDGLTAAQNLCSLSGEGTNCVAIDFVDRSFAIENSDNPALSRSGAASGMEQVDEWGRPVGPDALFFDVVSTFPAGDDDKYLRSQVYPRMTRYPQDQMYRWMLHNFLSFTERIERATRDADDAFNGVQNRNQWQVQLTEDLPNSPNGGSTTSKIAHDGNSGLHYCYFSFHDTNLIGLADPYMKTVFSVWMQPEEYGQAEVFFGGYATGTSFSMSTNDNADGTQFQNSNWTRVRVDLINGGILETIYSSETPTDGTDTIHFIEDYWFEEYSNGWKRHFFAVETTDYNAFTGWTNPYGPAIGFMLTDGTTNNFSDTAGKGFNVWGWCLQNQNTGLDGTEYKYIRNDGAGLVSLLPYEWDYETEGAAHGRVVATQSKGPRLRPTHQYTRVEFHVFRRLGHNIAGFILVVFNPSVEVLDSGLPDLFGGNTACRIRSLQTASLATLQPTVGWYSSGFGGDRDIFNGDYINPPENWVSGMFKADQTTTCSMTLNWRNFGSGNPDADTDQAYYFHVDFDLENGTVLQEREQLAVINSGPLAGSYRPYGTPKGEIWEMDDGWYQCAIVWLRSEENKIPTAGAGDIEYSHWHPMGWVDLPLNNAQNQWAGTPDVETALGTSIPAGTWQVQYARDNLGPSRPGPLRDRYLMDRKGWWATNNVSSYEWGPDNIQFGSLYPILDLHLEQIGVDLPNRVANASLYIKQCIRDYEMPRTTDVFPNTVAPYYRFAGFGEDNPDFNNDRIVFEINQGDLDLDKSDDYLGSNLNRFDIEEQKVASNISPILGRDFGVYWNLEPDELIGTGQGAGRQTLEIDGQFIGNATLWPESDGGDGRMFFIADGEYTVTLNGPSRVETGLTPNFGADYYAQELVFSTGALENPDVEPRWIEKLSLRSEAEGDTITKMADAGVFYEGPVSSVTLTHLSRRDDIVAWGTRVSDGATVPVTGLTSDGDGVVNLGEDYTNLFIGIQYTARYKSGKLAYAGGGGTALEQPKRVSEFGVLLANTHVDALKFGADFQTLRSMPRISKGKEVADNSIYGTYDDVAFTFPGLWNTDSRLCMQIESPYPCTLLGLVVSVETNPRGGR